MNKIYKLSALGPVAVLAGGGASALLLALTAGPGSATTTLTVDTLTDGVANATDCTAPVTDSCSLRDAIAAAADGDVIVFETGLAGTITLTEDNLHIEVGLTITGAGSDALTIDAAGNSRVFYVGSTAGDVTISGLKITGGDAGKAYGGGILALNSGSLNLVEVEVSGNASGSGAGVYANNAGDLNFTDTLLADNVAYVGGGGFYTSRNVVDVNITNSSITGNTSESSVGGAGGLISSGDLVVTGSIIADNTSAAGGGGFFLYQAGSATISTTTFSANTSGNAGGALYSRTIGAEIAISNSTFVANSAGRGGGALYLGGDRDEVVVINNSTIAGNTARTFGGGGISKGSGGSLTINQSTITENDAALRGGGLYLSGVGAQYVSGTVLELSGSIVSANTLILADQRSLPLTLGRLTGSAVSGGADIAMGGIDGDSFSSDHSLVGDISSDIVVTDLGGNITSDSPGLSPLADNGGATMTMALLANSVAIDAGPDPVAVFDGNGFDQRGTPWVRVYNGLVDIGAYEVQPDPAPPTTEAVVPGETAVPAFTG
jgi:predicted outer membrane repeat protein